MRACVKNSHIRWMLRWREVARAQSNGCEWSSGFAGLRSYDPSRSLSCRRQHPHPHYCYTEYINLSAAHPPFSLSSTRTHTHIHIHGHKTNRGKTHTRARGRPWVRGEKKEDITCDTNPDTCVFLRICQQLFIPEATTTVSRAGAAITAGGGGIDVCAGWAWGEWEWKNFTYTVFFFRVRILSMG